jgi:nucleoside-diphosphate-sugar epimerase
MKILITGASGLVGRATTTMCLKQSNWNISVVSRGLEVEHQIDKIYRSIDEVVDQNFDLILHAAAATPNNSQANLIAQTNHIIDGSLASCVSRNNIKHVIYISSMSVYGNIKEHKITELSQSRSPSEYGLSKLKGEFMVHNSCSKNNVKLTILRSPGIIGPGMSRIFVRNCIEAIRDGHVIKIPTPTSLFNNAIYVEDIFWTSLYAFSNQLSNAAIINLHSSNILKLTDFIEYIAKLLNKSAKTDVDTSITRSFIIGNEHHRELLKTRSLESMMGLYLKEFFNG